MRTLKVTRHVFTPDEYKQGDCAPFVYLGTGRNRSYWLNKEAPRGY